MTAGDALRALSPLPRPTGGDAAVAVVRTDHPASAQLSLERRQELFPSGSGHVVAEHSGTRAVVRFWHRDHAARHVALAASGWWRPVPRTACDLDAAGAGWWTGAFAVPADWQAAYRFVAHDGPGAPRWWDEGLRPARMPTGRVHARAGLSVRLPAGRRWLRADPERPPEHVLTLPTAPREPRVRLWRAPAPGRLPLVVVLDGEAHVDRLSTPAVLAAAVRAGALPPLVTALVDSGPARPDVLGVPGGHARWVADDLLPRLHGSQLGAGLDQRRQSTLVTGSSFGGLSALFALARGHERIGAAVAQSPSLWRYPEGALERPLAVAHQHAPLRLRLHTGRYEGQGPHQAGRLAGALAARGVDAEVRVVSGGHDWTWWVPEAVEEIARLLATAP